MSAVRSWLHGTASWSRIRNAEVLGPKPKPSSAIET